MRSMPSAVVAGACLACLGAVMGASAATAPGARLLGVPDESAGRGWRVVSRVTVPRGGVAMLSVAAVRGDDAWAAGFAGRRSVIERWTGRGWRRVAVPGKILAAFESDRPVAGYGGPPYPVIGASSQRNVWAFNQITGAWLRWDGRRWSHGFVPGRSGWAGTAITSALVLGRDDVWVFGGRLNGQGEVLPYAARFGGGRWVVTPMPRVPNLLVSAASAVRGDDIWAVIGYGGQMAFPAQGNGGALARWDGRRWRLARLAGRFARYGDPTSIVAVTDRDVWVGGGVANRQIQLTEAAARWDGSRWRVYKVPAAPSSADCVLRGMVVRRAGPVGLGDCFTDQVPGGVRSRLWRLVSGTWRGLVRPRVAGRPAVLTDIAGAGRGGSAWAVGFSGNAGIIALSGPVP